jgi:CMP-N,N'-diacetyllegionaminic acid synthase
MKTLAIIPARGGSKRIPDKNIRPFLGLPLILWTLRYARACPYFDRVIVSTDSQTIADVCKGDGFPVLHLRPAELAGDTTTAVDTALYHLDQIRAHDASFTHLAWLQPTSPLREHSTADKAAALLRAGHVAVVGMAPVRDHPAHMFTTNAQGDIVPFLDQASLTLRTQDHPPLLKVSGHLYWLNIAVFLKEKSFFPQKTCPLLARSALEAIDLDTPDDWITGEALGRAEQPDKGRP